MIIGGFVKNSFIDFPGHISCVIFTSGCNMNCWYCHNQSLISSKGELGSVDEILQFIKSRAGFLEGVVISGGEPTLHKDLKDVIKRIKELGLRVKLDTNGTNFEILQSLVKENLVDFVAMDIKAPFNSYKKITQTNDNIESIKKSAMLLINGNIDYEFRTTFAPNLTVSDIFELAKDISGAKKYVLQNCRIPESAVQYLPHKPSIVEAAVTEAKKHVPNTIIRGY